MNIRIFVNSFGLESFLVDAEKLTTIRVCVSKEMIEYAKTDVPIDKLKMKFLIEANAEKLQGKRILGYLREDIKKMGLIKITGYWLDNYYIPTRLPLPNKKKLKELGLT